MICSAQSPLGEIQSSAGLHLPARAIHAIVCDNGKRWVMCTAEDCLIWNDKDLHAFLADPDGSVWIGTNAGISHLVHPEHLFEHAAPEIQLAMYPYREIP